MNDWINGALSALAAYISTDNPGGLAAIFALTISADIGIPFPFALDIILFSTTYTLGALSWLVLLVILMLLSGSLVGTGIIHWISHSLGPRFVECVGRRSQFLQHNLEQFRNRLGRRTIPVIVGARLTPGLMQVSSVTTGTLRILYYKVVLAIILSSIVYDGTLITLGTLARLGLGLKDVGPEYSFWIVLEFVGIMTVLFVAVHLIRRRAKLRNEHN